MSSLKSMAASQASDDLQSAHNEIIDIIQQIRNTYTEGEKMTQAIEERIDSAYFNLQKGRSWVKALSMEN